MGADYDPGRVFSAGFFKLTLMARKNNGPKKKLVFLLKLS